MCVCVRVCVCVCVCVFSDITTSYRGVAENGLGVVECEISPLLSYCGEVSDLCFQ